MGGPWLRTPGVARRRWRLRSGRETVPGAALPVLLLLGWIVVASSLMGVRLASADLGGFIIREFHTELHVRGDATLEVVERLEVEFLEQRHGIYRTIPFRYTDPRGYQYSFDIRLLSVTDGSGRSHGTKVSRSGRYYKIRIGDADRYVSGNVAYEIRYRVEDAIAHFPEHDEIYWNTTGHEWQTRIEKATAVVHLPAPLGSDSIQAVAFAGSFGSKEEDVRITHPSPGKIRYECTRPLDSLEGMTVAAAWPHGYVDFPGPLDRAWSLLRDNWILLAPVLWFVLLYRRYRSHGKDPVGAGSVVVRYEPPAGLSPAEIGTVIDEKVDLQDITATVIDLAVRGYLTIEERAKSRLFGLFESSETVFVRNRERDPIDLKPHEQKVFDGIFKHGDEVEKSDLKNEFYSEIEGIRDSVQRTLASAGLFSGSARSIRRRYVGYGFAAAILTFGVGIVSAAAMGAIFPNAMIVPMVAGAATLLIFIAFSPAMPKRTREGVRQREWALGFQEFARRVEADRIERDLAGGRPLREVFETLLPYAMALGVGSSWAKKFRDIYVDAGPTWYVGPNFAHGITPRSLESSVSDSMRSVGASMVSSPRSSGSSGFGGGGFSGGGGGGGGGGSW